MSAPVAPGDILAGKYRVERVLGVGGMGVVVSATHVQLDQLVALKFMLPHVLGNQEAISRFLREAKAAVRLKGEHVARVLDVGTLETGAPYIVMEYLEGCDLSEALQRRGPLPVEEACTYLLQACEAMAEAHAQSIVHRDLKPQNLFLARRPDGGVTVKILDFGISKATIAGNTNFETQTSAIMGSPAYMSPEQMRSSKDVDARTDIWALGVILFQLLSQRLPYEADAMLELLVKVSTEEPQMLRSIRPDLPADIERIVHRCLCKDRDQRYPNVAALAADLKVYAPRIGAETLDRVSRMLDVPKPSASLPPAKLALDATVASDAALPAVVPKSVSTTLGGAASAIETPPRKRKSLWLPLVIAGSVGAGGLLTALVTRRGGDSAAVTPAGSTTSPAAAAAPPPSVVDAAVPVEPPPAPAAAVVMPPDAGVPGPAEATQKSKKTQTATVKHDKAPATTKSPTTATTSRQTTTPTATMPVPVTAPPPSVDNDPYSRRN